MVIIVACICISWAAYFVFLLSSSFSSSLLYYFFLFFTFHVHLLDLYILAPAVYLLLLYTLALKIQAICKHLAFESSQYYSQQRILH